MNPALLKFSHIRVERALFWLQCVLLCGAVAAYIYFTAMSVVHVVLRQELVISIQNVETRISQLEADYLAGASKLSQESIAHLGLVELTLVEYVSVGADGGRLTRRP